MERWKRPDRLPRMTSLGVDVARGGRDETVIARRHGMWFDVPLAYPGAETPNGPAVAGLVIAAQRDRAPMHIDVIGVGSSPYDFLASARLPAYGVNVAEGTYETDVSGRLPIKNVRSLLWWRMREALDPTANTGIALPPDDRLRVDLCTPKWDFKTGVIRVESREDIEKRIQRSPDYGSAYVLALIDTPRVEDVLGEPARRAARDHDPYAALGT